MTTILRPAEPPRLATRIASGGARARVLCRAELDAATVLAAFAAAEARADVARQYRAMADRESEHARRWALALYEASGRMPARTPSWLARLLAATGRRFGPARVAPLVRRLQRWHHGLVPGR